jgi:hypothetical protein
MNTKYHRDLAIRTQISALRVPTSRPACRGPEGIAHSQIVVTFELKNKKERKNFSIRVFPVSIVTLPIYLVEQNLGRNVFGCSAQRPRAVLDVFRESEIGDAHVAIAGRT